MIESINNLKAKFESLVISDALDPSERANIFTANDRSMHELEVDMSNNSIRLGKSIIGMNGTITKLLNENAELKREIKILNRMKG
jgi:DNA replication protein DnaD